MKKTAGKSMLGLVSLFITVAGATFLLSPESAAAKLMVTPGGPESLSNLRAFVGAPLVGIGVSLFIGAVTARLDHARAAALFVVMLIAARLLSLAVDGFSAGSLVNLAVPVGVLVFMVVGHKLIDAGEADEASARGNAR